MMQELISILISLKSTFFKYALIGISLISPLKIFILLVGFFIFLDTCFGVWAAKRTNMPLSSNGLSRFISKALTYNLLIITSYILDINLLGEFFLLVISIPLVITKLTVISLILNEIYSIDEKINNVSGYGLWHLFKRVLNLAKYIKKQKDQLL